jgi:hypothetical protein
LELHVFFSCHILKAIGNNDYVSGGEPPITTSQQSTAILFTSMALIRFRYFVNMIENQVKVPFILVAIVLLATIAIFLQVICSPIHTIAQNEVGEPSIPIPQATCIYKNQEYPLTPHIFNDGEKSSRIAFPHLPDNYAPEMTIPQGEVLTMEFEANNQPTDIEALLVDYDADITETYPLKKIDDNKFELTQSGIKTLEVIASFPNNEHVSYTMLVDVKDNNGINY